jgi:hypothetical protein
MTNKQQALEELAAVMDKWDIEILINENNAVIVEVNYEPATSAYNFYGVNAGILNNELRRMKQDER